jgi:peptide/nickel transport system permease protein
LTGGEVKMRAFWYRLRTRIAAWSRRRRLTALALALGHVVSGAVLVEIVFGYPGIGTLLFQAVRNFDYPVIYGISFMIIVAIGLSTLVLDLLLPVLDPRIKYSRS